TAAKLEAKLGYGPREAVEVQTLMGDAIDNVPGIPGVGEKTAAKLVKQYGNVEGILSHVAELTPRLRENLQKHGSQLDISRQLVTLNKDVDCAFDPEKCLFTGLDVQAVRPHLVELGFTSLLKRLGVDGEGPKPPPKKVERFEEGL